MSGDLSIGELIGDNPVALARGIAGHPGMYMGGPETYERAVAFVFGVEMAVLATGADSPLGPEDKALLMERPPSDRRPEHELAEIRRFEPVLTKLFVGLPRERMNTRDQQSSERPTEEECWREF